MDGGEREERGNEGEKTDENKAELESDAPGALSRVQFCVEASGGRNLVVDGLGGAIAGDGWDFFEGDDGFFRDGVSAAHGGGMREPFFAPAAPADRHHVEFRKLEESGDGGARIAGGRDSSSIGSVFETARPEIRKDGNDGEDQGVAGDD